MIRNRKKSKFLNYNNFRTLYESIIPNEVLLALDDWKKNYNNENYVLIGGLALSYYLKPRYTEDIDLIFLTEGDIPERVFGFNRNRLHSFEHRKTGVEVELLTPEHLNEDSVLFEKVFEFCNVSDGIKIASPVGLIALKLSRFNERDRYDIKNLYNYCMLNNIDINLEDYSVSKENLDKFNNLEFDKEINESQSTMDIHNYMKSKYISYNVNDTDKIFIFESKFGEPRFYYSNNIEKRILGFNDFKFGISIIDHIKILESATDSIFIKNKNDLIEFIENNNDLIIKSWNKLNPNRRINI